jgi:hypothetical protein
MRVRGAKIMIKKLLTALAVVFSAALLVTAANSRLEARQGGAVGVDADDIGGVVRSSSGPEAGVWVIAQTKDLPTTLAKIVVTDDQGRYVLPDLPRATYTVWVRGYGLVDSKPVSAAPGRTLNLSAVVAPSPVAAAQYYPASYWISMIRMPAKSEFPIGPFQTQMDWVTTFKGSVLVWQIGDKATREIPEKLGRFKTTKEAWQAWAKSPDFPYGLSGVAQMGDRAFDMLADWTDRIRAGEVPPAPPRPQGLERNLVITQWDWSKPKGFIHDLVSSDRNNPTVNANGPVYGIEQHSADVMDVLDPNTYKTWQVQVPVKDPTLPNEPAALSVTVPLTWGEENVRPGIATLHNPMMDHLGRVWITAKFRKGLEAQPAFCKQGSDQSSAKFFPLDRNTANGSPGGRQVEVYDPKTKQFAMVDLCFGTHHLDFADDANHTLWFSGGTDVMGWLNTKAWNETHDDAKAQGWTPYIVDTNGNGKPDPGWVELPAARRGGAGAPLALDGTKDLRVRGTTYGLGPAPDGSVWGAVPTGYILHVIPGANPPSTTVTEIYRPPATSFAANLKGVNVDRSSGVVWVAAATSGTLASFDRRKCKILNGPKATGDHCPEGWTFYPTPGPKFKNVTDPLNTDYHYLQWVDQHDIFGLGPNTPLLPGTNSDSMIAFQPTTGKFLQFVVPYPMGFYARGVDGRIDDPKGGWKGRALWTTYASVTPWAYEGGISSTQKAVKLQLRPNPLAK